MLCCQKEGALTDKTYSYIWAICTHPVQLSAGCLGVVGPVNVTAYNIFNDSPTARQHRFIVDWNETSAFEGPISINIESAR